MKQIEVCYSNSMKINKGSYEQESPFYSAKSIITLTDEEQSQIDEVMGAEYDRLKALINPMLQADYKASKPSEMTNIRIREKDGKKYPSVTSILRPDPINFKGKIPLEKYGERGNQADVVFKNTLIGLPVPEVDASKFEPLKWEYDIPKFIEENKAVFAKKKWQSDVPIFNEEYMYSGEIDLLSPTILLDVKTGQWKWEQLVAYAKSVEGVKTIAIADLKNNKMEVIDLESDEARKAWESFIFKRGEFKARFGI